MNGGMSAAAAGDTTGESERKELTWLNAPGEPDYKRQKFEDTTVSNVNNYDGDHSNDSEGDNKSGSMVYDNDDVQIVDPPQKTYHDDADADVGNKQNGKNTYDKHDDNDDDDIQVMASTTTNPNIDFPHQRPLCGVHPFGEHNDDELNYDDDDKNGTDNIKQRRLLFCPKCYCVVCDVPANECQEWNDHCQAVTNKVKKLEQNPGDGGRGVVDVDMEDFNQQSDDDEVSDYEIEDFVQFLARSRPHLLPASISHEMSHLASSSSSYNRNNNSFIGGKGMESTTMGGVQSIPCRDAKKMRITEVFGLKLALQMQTVLRLSEGGRSEQGQRRPANKKNDVRNQEEASKQESIPFTTRFGTELYKMEGDIPQLGLHSSFFVEGIKIGWPFPTILAPQRQMAFHIIRALKRRLHCVLESPTGTGKSAAILCSVLAWQRYHVQMSTDETEDTLTDDEYNNLTKAEKQGRAAMKIILNQKGEGSKSVKSVPQIIYCSRTHSQVAQMVASLKKTPYRPKMTILGSRERMCIHKHVRGSDNKLPINMACQYRRGNTEAERKRLLSENSMPPYDDDNPAPVSNFNGDGPSYSHVGDGDILDQENAGNGSQRKPAATCPHYRQLSTSRTAEMVVNRFVGNPHKTSCCTTGGEESSFGLHDMEDLVAFGKDPYTEHISVYRGSDGKFGFAIGKIRNPVTNKEAGGCYIDDVVESSQADQDGRLQEGDLILEVNGKDARQWMLEQVLEELQTTPSLKPLRLKVKHREQSNAVPAAAVDRIQKDESHDNLSDHAICPYYISRAIQPHAEITFAPYNYILDPGIRKAMNIGLKNTVIVLDEAHNIESTLCEGGSFKYGEIDLSQIVSVLGPFARRNPNTGNITLIDTGVQEDTSFVAHELLCFVETIISHLSTLRESFENDSPHIRELEEKYERFGNVPDDHEVEVCFHGPTGHGFQGETVGCKPFFDRPGLEKFNLPYFERLLHYAVSFESEIFGGEQNSSIESQRRSYTFSKIIDLLAKLQKAAENPEHYYICCTVQANGNLDHAFCKNSGGRSPGWKKNPQSYPFMPPHDGRSPLADVRRCNQEDCESLHGEYCNGTTPRWECHLVLKLLSPGLLLKDISKQCRSLILASGSLSPIPSLCAELNLFGPEEATTPQTTPSKSTFSPLKSQPGRKHEHLGRLQTKPAPLEANHVIDLSKQLLAVAIGIFPDGTQLTVNFNNYQHDDFYAKLGDAIASVIEGVPSGGVLVFVPSYTFLKRCITSWDSKNGHERDNGTVSTEIWERILTSKGKIIVEPNKGQDEFEAARDEYRDTISKTGSCVLLAVFRGKMSEGISFNDNNARAVICVGLPFPAAKERSVVTKKNYNDEQRRFRKNTSLLPGNEWYSQQAYRAIAQALGRCIRHGADYGTIILMDSRHCNDGSPNLDNQDGVCRAHRNLPKWMRGCVRTLSPNKTKGTKSDDILGGYAGLRSCMHAFFEQAPAVSDAVKKKWKEDLQKAQERSQSTAGRVFNNITGRWDASSAVKPEKL